MTTIYKILSVAPASSPIVQTFASEGKVWISCQENIIPDIVTTWFKPFLEKQRTWLFISQLKPNINKRCNNRSSAVVHGFYKKDWCNVHYLLEIIFHYLHVYCCVCVKNCRGQVEVLHWSQTVSYNLHSVTSPLGSSVAAGLSQCQVVISGALSTMVLGFIRKKKRWVFFLSSWQWWKIF